MFDPAASRAFAFAASVSGRRASVDSAPSAKTSRPTPKSRSLASETVTRLEKQPFPSPASFLGELRKSARKVSALCVLYASARGASGAGEGAAKTTERSLASRAALRLASASRAATGDARFDPASGAGAVSGAHAPAAMATARRSSSAGFPPPGLRPRSRHAARRSRRLRSFGSETTTGAADGGEDGASWTGASTVAGATRGSEFFAGDASVAKMLDPWWALRWMSVQRSWRGTAAFSAPVADAGAGGASSAGLTDAGDASGAAAGWISLRGDMSSDERRRCASIRARVVGNARRVVRHHDTRHRLLLRSPRDGRPQPFFFPRMVFRHVSREIRTLSRNGLARASRSARTPVRARRGSAAAASSRVP